MRFAGKMIALVAVMMALSLALGGFFVVRSAFRGELEAAVAGAQEEMKLFGMTLQALCLREDGDQGPEASVLQVLRDNPALQNYEYRVYDSEGAPLAGTARDLTGELTEADVGTIESRLAVQNGRRYIHTSQKLMLFERGFGLELWREVTDIYARAEENLNRYELVMWAILLVGVGLTTGFTLLATRPIRRISRTSKQLSMGRYEKRVKVKSRDELGQLARDFNAMADALERKIQELEEAAQRQRDFTASFAHELKTPLTSVIGYADTLRSRELPRAQQLEAAGYIFSEGHRLEAMSFALLDLFALESKAPRLRGCSAGALARAVEASVTPSLQAAGMELRLKVEDRRLEAEPALVQTALCNLIDNARKAERPGAELLLTGAPEPEGGYRFTVTDRGRGIPSQALERITEPFFTVDKSRARAQGGAGLGLSLCQRIAQAHGGRLEFESREGQGTRASLILGGNAHES